LDEALDGLAEHRLREGERMGTLLSGHIDEIEELCVKAEKLAAVQPEALRARLLRQLKDCLENLPELNEERISQEAAVLMTTGRCTGGIGLLERPY